MRTLRVAASVTALCLAFGSSAVDAQESLGETASELAFEVTLPPEVMSDQLERINTGGLFVDPGVVAEIGTDNEAIRGRLIYLESGVLEVTPMMESLVWRGDEVIGGAPTTVPAGEVVSLGIGDLVFLPAIATRDIAPDSVITIANPGDIPVVTRGFHAHTRGGSFPGWPQGITDREGFSEISDYETITAIMAEGATFRSTRLDAPVGASIPLADAPAWTMIDVLDGKVDRTFTGPEGASPPFWNPIHGGALRSAPDWTMELAVAGDAPATVNEMTVLPGEPE